MRSFLYGTLWIFIYLIIIVAPLFVLMIGPIPPGRGFWREFSVGIGFVGLSMIEWNIRYESWRLTHALLSVVVVALSLIHIEGVGYYVQGALKRWFWIGLVTAWVLSLVYVRIIKPIGMLKRPYTIEEIISERGKAWTLVLRPEGHPDLSFKLARYLEQYLDLFNSFETIYRLKRL